MNELIIEFLFSSKFIKSDKPLRSKKFRLEVTDLFLENFLKLGLGEKYIELQKLSDPKLVEFIKLLSANNNKTFLLKDIIIISYKTIPTLTKEDLENLINNYSNLIMFKTELLELSDELGSNVVYEALDELIYNTDKSVFFNLSELAKDENNGIWLLKKFIINFKDKENSFIFKLYNLMWNYELGESDIWTFDKLYSIFSDLEKFRFIDINLKRKAIPNNK
ncbi:MAG: hypothetical protein [Bacteriophage sp.]|nr:MAG: hypothetical protein [Bacteriophage sp.]